ncbi:hypothetical protein M1295_02495 [Patescibacteria group bacterium]|nr:hypothetical protein [Patescibacteria group bacterium]
MKNQSTFYGKEFGLRWYHPVERDYQTVKEMRRVFGPPRKTYRICYERVH